MKFSKWFVRINWIALIAIYLVIIAGSFVRITGSGMGCPDWPKCFGQWVPPTEESSLPKNYKAIYVDKREKKVAKFCAFLNTIGLENTAKKIKNDETLLVEEDFNVKKTWTEYVNRLFGFIAGNSLLLVFLWILLKYRKKKLILVSGVNLIILAFQAWFGSIVVATNLVPWTITVHMLLALVIIGLQLYLIYLIAPSQQKQIKTTKLFFWSVFAIFVITFFQMFLGTQVREEIDYLRKSGIARADWNEYFGMRFFIHRSFSWLVLILLTIMFWIKRNDRAYRIIHWAFLILALELISGVLLAYFNMPGLIQTAHLLFATVLFGILVIGIFRLDPHSKT